MVEERESDISIDPTLEKPSLSAHKIVPATLENYFEAHRKIDNNLFSKRVNLDLTSSMISSLWAQRGSWAQVPL